MDMSMISLSGMSHRSTQNQHDVIKIVASLSVEARNLIGWVRTPIYK